MVVCRSEGWHGGRGKGVDDYPSGMILIDTWLFILETILQIMVRSILMLVLDYVMKVASSLACSSAFPYCRSTVPSPRY